MKKLLIISALYQPYHIGGAEISTQILAEGLTSKYNITILTHDKSDSKVVINNVNVVRHNFGVGSKSLINKCNGKKNSIFSKFISKFKDIFYSHKISKYYKQFIISNNFDLIIYSGNCVNMGRNNLIKVGHKKNFKQLLIIRDPLLLYFNNSQPSNRFLDYIYRKMNYCIISRLNHVVGITDNILDQHIKYGFNFKNTSIIPNCVDLNKCYKSEEKNNNILYVGAISKQKGVDFLIDCFLKNNFDNKLVLIGRIIDVVIPISEKIIYLGEQNIDFVYKTMSQSRIVVLPSIWMEAFGRVLIEAVFNNTIAIGSMVGGIPNVLENDTNFLFESNNESTLINLLKKYLYCSREEYDNYLNIERNHFNKYTIENQIKEYTELFDEILEEN